jgi:hypothetical protein
MNEIQSSKDTHPPTPLPNLSGILVGAVLIGLVVSGWAFFRQAGKNEVRISSTDLIINKLEEMGELAVLRVCASNIVDAVNPNEKVRGLWVIEGDALLAVNMRQAVIDKAGENKYRVSLPQPQMLQARVDHEKSHVYRVDEDRWTDSGEALSKLEDQAWKEGQKKIERLAKSQESVDRAKASAEAVLKQVFACLCCQVDITWQSIK